jgi:integration host factor subunit alpha
MRINLTKKDLINSLYMQIGFSKKISGDLLDDILVTISDNLKENGNLKISKFGTFTVRSKKSRQGRNPITKESKIISNRNVVLFKPSKEFKYLVNSSENDQN